MTQKGLILAKTSRKESHGREKSRKKATEVSFHWLKLFPSSQEYEDWLLDNGQVPADAFKKLVGD